MINLAIITGVSGAGKTYVLSAFEDNNFHVIDNIPLALVKDLVIEAKKNPDKYSKIALAIPLGDAEAAYDIIKQEKGFKTIFLGLDCSVETLLERYRLARRQHPLQVTGHTLEECIELDKSNILKIQEKFTHYVDTSKLSLGQLRKYLYSTIFTGDETRLTVTFVSFGYKKQMPLDVELVLDARVLPNPFWEEDLKEMTGLDQPVIDYIFKSDVTTEFLKHVTEYLDYYLEKVSKAGRKAINVGVACSGGQHRSVAVSEYLKKYYSKKYNTNVSHRELGI